MCWSQFFNQESAATVQSRANRADSAIEYSRRFHVTQLLQVAKDYNLPVFLRQSQH
jgi:hypothetical protein